MPGSDARPPRDASEGALAISTPSRASSPIRPHFRMPDEVPRTDGDDPAEPNGIDLTMRNCTFVSQ